jgi:hypothetical protein
MDKLKRKKKLKMHLNNAKNAKWKKKKNDSLFIIRLDELTRLLDAVCQEQ